MDDQKSFSFSKRLLAILLIALFSSSLLFSGVTEINRQKIHSVDSDVYEAIKYLYIATGLALPSTTGPWSEAELDLMLKRIDVNKLNESAKVTYNYVRDELGKSARINPSTYFGLDIGLDVAVEAYGHTNTTDFSKPDDWGGKRNYNPRTPLLSIPLETWIGSLVYGYSSLDVGVNRILNTKEGKFFTNIFMVPPSAFIDFNMNFPYRAIGSIGGSFWNFSIGRDKLSWGPGESGNLVLGDHIPYHNNARFTAFSNHFKYTFSLSSFVHPKNYTTPSKDQPDHDLLNLAYSQTEPRDGIKMYIAHRLEWRIVDKVNMALTEAIIYQSDTNFIDLTIISPTVLFHNYFIRGNANSTLALDIDYTPINHLNIYASGIIDDLALPGEVTPGSAGPPNAFGIIAGLKTSVPLGKGMFYATLEGAYTDPYLYLRNVSVDNVAYTYGINYIVAMPEYLNNGKGEYTLSALGYRYGNDSIVGNLKAGYKVFGNWSIELDYTYIADGCLDINSIWRPVVANSADDPRAPTSSDTSSGSYVSGYDQSSRNAVAHWNVINLSGGITLFKNLDIYATFTYINILNYQNIRGEKTNDIQLTLGVSYYV